MIFSDSDRSMIHHVMLLSLRNLQPLREGLQRRMHTPALLPAIMIKVESQGSNPAGGGIVS